MFLIIALLLLATPACAPTHPSANAHAAIAHPATDLVTAFDAQAAYRYTRKIVSFGEREPGSPGHRKAEDFIVKTLQEHGAVVESDDYTAHTPIGPIAERNIIARYGGNHGEGNTIFAIAGHYDTVFMKGFVGANDGGSSAGILLAFADALQRFPPRNPVWLLFLDGEEAVKTWGPNDSLYGSRHLAAKWQQSGVAQKVRALILVDMIGDKDLDIGKETNSTPWLQDFIYGAAQKLGYSSYFFRSQEGVEDDHLPFLKAGIASVDLGDWTYGPVNSRTDSFGAYHHTLQDTMDKLSPHSFQVVGEVVLKAIEMLEAQ